MIVVCVCHQPNEWNRFQDVLEPSELTVAQRHRSTGGKTKLLGISKRGNPYLHELFIHGARAMVLRAKREGPYLGQWMKSDAEDR